MARAWAAECSRDPAEEATPHRVHPGPVPDAWRAYLDYGDNMTTEVVKNVI